MSLTTFKGDKKWSVLQDSNLRPLRPKRSALPSCAKHRHRHFMVRKERLELSHLAILEPKSSASTNSATSANSFGLSLVVVTKWWLRPDLNRGPHHYE